MEEKKWICQQREKNPKIRRQKIADDFSTKFGKSIKSLQRISQILYQKDEILGQKDGAKIYRIRSLSRKLKTTDNDIILYNWETRIPTCFFGLEFFLELNLMLI